MAAVTIGTKTPGDIVKIKVNGALREFIIVHQGLPSSIYDASCNGTWVLMKDCYESRQWHSSNVNDYANSTIHAYLNSTFLNLIDANIRAVIKQVKIPYVNGTANSAVASGTNGLSAKVFLLSGYEVGFSTSFNSGFPVDGTKLTHFISGNDTSAQAKRIAHFNGSAVLWWLRSPNIDYSNRAWFIYPDGGGASNVCSDSWGVRPAFILPSNAICVNSDGTLTINAPPTAPASITVPEAVKGGASLTISWGAATDPDGNLSGYKLERSAGGGAWTQVYSGSARSYTDSITYGWSSVAYRVRAYDALGEHSPYATGPTRTVVNNSAPTTPVGLTVPALIRGGKPLELSWGLSTDVDGNLAGYELERRVDGGAWAQLCRGVDRAYTDSITRGWATAQYRARAYDNEGAQSPYITSEARTVVNNLPPDISGQDGDLGQKDAAFSQSYTVTDDDGDPVTVTEALDGVELRSFSAVLGQEYTLSIGADRWMEVLNGSHTLTVTARDDHGGESARAWTFSKDIRRLTITLREPLAADAAVAKAVLSITRQIPVGASLTIELCNNAHDEAPAWEDATAALLAGRKFFFQNTAKTAAAWGFNFRVTVDRLDGVGDCYIAGIGGNFA